MLVKKSMQTAAYCQLDQLWNFSSFLSFNISLTAWQQMQNRNVAYLRSLCPVWPMFAYFKMWWLVVCVFWSAACKPNSLRVENKDLNCIEMKWTETNRQWQSKRCLLFWIIVQPFEANLDLRKCGPAQRVMCLWRVFETVIGIKLVLYICKLDRYFYLFIFF